MPKTLDDLRTLGLDLGIAHGDVQPERDALVDAETDARPEAVAAAALAVTSETLGDLANAGQLPDDPADRRALTEKIAAQALDQIATVTSANVEFHTRAVEIAASSPDVWVISGPGFSNLYVACKPDGTGWDADAQEILDALADPASHAERCFQNFAPDEIVRLALTARALGAEVEGDGDETSWTLKVDGKPVADEAALTAIVEKLKP